MTAIIAHFTLSAIAALFIYWIGSKAPFMYEDEVNGIRCCRICGGKMEKGDYILQTFTGIPDFPGDKHPVTFSPGGPGKLVKNGCFKCGNCGWSYHA